MTRTVDNCSVIKACREMKKNLPTYDEEECSGCVKRGRLHPICTKCKLCVKSNKHKSKRKESN